ncbi:hypothetical protein TELCIR_17745, partial [Teladorsagia circumcincta]
VLAFSHVRTYFGTAGCSDGHFTVSRLKAKTPRYQRQQLLPTPRSRKENRLLKEGFIDDNNDDLSYFNFRILWPAVTCAVFSMTCFIVYVVDANEWSAIRVESLRDQCYWQHSLPIMRVYTDVSRIYAVMEYVIIVAYAVFQLTALIDIRHVTFVCYPRTCSGECEPLDPENFVPGAKFEHCRAFEYQQRRVLNL